MALRWIRFCYLFHVCPGNKIQLYISLMSPGKSFRLGAEPIAVQSYLHKIHHTLLRFLNFKCCDFKLILLMNSVVHQFDFQKQHV